MKKLRYIITILAFAGMYACNSLLETTPDDFLPPQLTYKTAEELESALAGVYEILSQSDMYSVNLISEMGLEADEGYHRADTRVTGPQVYSFGPSDVMVTNLWKQLYTGINRANAVLANIDRPNMDQKRRDEIKGEALFLRAYYYFLLVINWGDVPLKLEVTTTHEGSNIPRSPAAKVYERITADLKDAEKLVAKITDLGYGGRANKSAARGMLARVYLHWAGYPLKDEAKYEDARTWALAVMESGEGHMLNPSFEEVFKNYSADKYDIKESLFEVEFWGNLKDAYHAVGRVGNVNGVQSSDEEIGYAYGYIRITPKLYNLYEAQDLRRDWAICPYYYDKNGKQIQQSVIRGRSAGKFRREYETCLPRHRLGTPINFPILRYSDVLLMFAEAENKVNGPTQAAHDALNEVRERAGATLFKDDKAIASPEAFQNVIIEERSRELCFEALRKHDLIRWGIFVREMRAVIATLPADAYYLRAFNNVSDKHLLYPIPTRELSLNRALTQNPGW